MGTVYTSAVAAIPSPLTREFLPWVGGLINFRLAECPIARSTTYYVAYDAAGDGTGGSGAGTEADPYLCATVDHIDTLYSSVASGGDVALLLKRGDAWTATATGIAMDIANTTIGAYGTGADPILWPPGTRYVQTGFAQAGGSNRYVATLTTSPGWIVIEADRTTTILSRQAAILDVTNTSNSWHWVSNALHVNLGGADPNTLTIRSFDTGNLIGVNLSADGTRLHGVEATGWGINSASTSNQAHGIKTTVSGTNAAVVSDCQSYYGSSHLIAHNLGSGTGGIATFVDCRAGLAQKNSGGETIFNGYSQAGGGEYIFDGCTTTHGTLPEGTAAYIKNAGTVYSHTGTGTNSLVIARNQTTDAGTFGCSGAARFASLPTAAAITSVRGFIIGETFNGPGSANGTGPARTPLSYDNEARINCRLNLSPVGSITVGAFNNDDVGGWALNCIYSIDLTGCTSAAFGLWNAPAANPSDASFFHCRFDVTGNATTNLTFDFDAVTQSDACLLKSSIITASGFSGGKTLKLNLGNNLVNATNIASNAYFGVDGGSDTTTDDGYGNDAGKVELASAPALLDRPSVALIGTGEDVGLEYDYNGTARSTVDIGPIAASTTSTLRRGKIDGIIGRPLRGKL